MIDKYSSVELIKMNHPGWLDKCLSNPKISHEEKSWIAINGNYEHKTKLLDHHELDNNTKSCIARYGNDEHRID